MCNQVRDLTLIGDWEHANGTSQSVHSHWVVFLKLLLVLADLKVVIKGFSSVERVEMSGKKVTDSILDCATKCWSKLRHLKLHNTKASIDSKLKLIAASKYLTSVSLDTSLDVSTMSRLGLASLREVDGSSILSKLYLDGDTWSAPDLSASLSAWNVIGAQLPELTSFTTCLKISDNESGLTGPDITIIPRLERLEISLAPASRWGSAQLVPNDPTINVHKFLARLLPACPRLQTLHLRYRKDHVSKKDARAGKKPTPFPQKPNAKLWAKDLKSVVFTGDWTE